MCTIHPCLCGDDAQKIVDLRACRRVFFIGPPRQATAHVSVADLQRELAWPVERAEAGLNFLLRQGVLWVDAQAPGGKRKRAAPVRDRVVMVQAPPPPDAAVRAALMSDEYVTSLLRRCCPGVSAECAEVRAAVVQLRGGVQCAVGA